MISKNSKIFVAGHRGLVGSAVINVKSKRLQKHYNSYQN